MDSSMPKRQLCARPQRLTPRSHSGMDSAPHPKYTASAADCMASLACRRSCRKNSTSVAGMALAMPLSR
jgi:hypothetical protein